MFDAAEVVGASKTPQASTQMAQELKEITALYNVGVVLNSSLNPKEVVWAVYRESSRLIDTSNFALSIIDKKKNAFAIHFGVSSG